jgi:flagellar assembly factor FliW
MILTFPEGLKGFSKYTTWKLGHLWPGLAPEHVPEDIRTYNPETPFRLLEALDTDLRFVLLDPNPYLQHYEMPLHENHRDRLQLLPEEVPQLWVICHLINSQLNVNLAGPLVVNPRIKVGYQIVNLRKPWSELIRCPLHLAV